MTTKILVADDSATMRRVLEMTFAGEDARVLSVNNGEAAVAKASEVTPDVVFADASMDGMDGYEVAKRIKASPSLANTAVVVMASQHNPYDEGRGRACGVDDHISKPFDTQSVIDRIGQVLARPRAKSAGSPAAAAPPPPPPAPAAAAQRPPAATGGVPKPAPAAAAPRPSSANGTVAGIGTAAPAPAPANPATSGAKPAPAAAPPPPAPAAAAAAKPAATAPQPAPARAAAAATASTSSLADKLSELGLSKDQVEGVLSLSREVIEQVVWEVVPDLAETLIKEEIQRLTAD